MFDNQVVCNFHFQSNMLFFNTIVTLIKLKLQFFCEMSCLKKMNLFFLEIMQGLILFHLEIHSLILFYSILFYSVLFCSILSIL